MANKGRHEIKISIANTFIESMSDLTKAMQKKTREFLVKFKDNPYATSINYENIANSTDKNMKSVRVDYQYRAIVLKPETGDEYTLLYVANHDDAYKWATSHKLNYESNDYKYKDLDVTIIPFMDERINRLKNASVKDLYSIGVDLALIDELRSIHEIDELERYIKMLSSETNVKLNHLMNGYTMNQIEEMTKESYKNLFVIVEDDDIELNEYINKPSNAWKLFLHPKQKEIVDKNFNGPAKIIGAAGTGKTIVGIHRAKKIIDNINEDDKVLLTTFTKSLSYDLKKRIDEICPINSKNITIENIDSVILQLYKSEKLTKSFEYDNKDTWLKVINNSKSTEKYDLNFIMDEYNQVFLANECKTADDYIKSQRIGRSKKIDRLSKQYLAELFLAFQQENNYINVLDYESYKLYLRDIVLKRHPNGMYRYIIVDEAQDMSTQTMKLIRALLGENITKENCLLIIGDSRQRIYSNKLTLKSCGIDVVGRSESLNLNYRTTDQIQHFATNVLKNEIFDDLNGEHLKLSAIQSLLYGEAPQISSFESFDLEVLAIKNHLNELISKGVDFKEICVTCRTNQLVSSYFDRINGEFSSEIVTGDSEDSSTPKIKFMTMHRLKGLEFEHILVVGLSNDMMPLYSLIDSNMSSTEKEEVIRVEKSLLYVAMTRARYTLWISASDQLTEFL